MATTKKKPTFASTCSCTPSDHDWTRVVPAFVNEYYFCATGRMQTLERLFYSEDPLWDGHISIIHHSSASSPLSRVQTISSCGFVVMVRAAIKNSAPACGAVDILDRCTHRRYKIVTLKRSTIIIDCTNIIVDHNYN